MAQSPPPDQRRGHEKGEGKQGAGRFEREGHATPRPSIGEIIGVKFTSPRSSWSTM
jgi:hypothetical protein